MKLHNGIKRIKLMTTAISSFFFLKENILNKEDVFMAKKNRTLFSGMLISLVASFESSLKLSPFWHIGDVGKHYRLRLEKN